MNCHYCMQKIESRVGRGDVGMIRPTGYAKDGNGQYVCYSCAAWLDVIAMRDGKDPGLYLSRDANGVRVKNWPGTLDMPVTNLRRGLHNMTGTKSTVHFIGPNGSVWTGTEYDGPASGNLLRGVRPLKTKHTGFR